MTTRAYRLTKKEWAEIAAIDEIRDRFGIESVEDVRALRDWVYAARFAYVADGPGYAGDLYVIMGGTPDTCPMTVIRTKDGGLVLAR